MKRKKFRWPLLIAGLLLALYITGRVTGMLQFFSIPTNSSKPNINPGEYVVVSNLVSPQKFDNIVFKYYDSFLQQKQHRTYRLCGLPGDTIQIKYGELFVNDLSSKGLFDVCQPYYVAVNDLQNITAIIKLAEDEIIPRDQHKAEVILSDADCAKLKAQHIEFERHIIPVDEKVEYIQKVFGQAWNYDHFGPYIVPAGHYFVLGDNRTRAQDSRYIGPIPIADFYGTVISK